MSSMTDMFKDPDTGMSISTADYEKIFRSRVEWDRETADAIDSATIAAESLQKSIESGKEE